MKRDAEEHLLWCLHRLMTMGMYQIAPDKEIKARVCEELVPFLIDIPRSLLDLSLGIALLDIGPIKAFIGKIAELLIE